MGKALLFLVGAFVITGGSLIYGTVNKGSQENTERVGRYASQITAREVAHTGIQEAVFKLSQAYKSTTTYTGPMTWEGSYQGGKYENTISISGMMHSVRTSALVDGKEYIVQREYLIDPLAAIPQGMRRALNSEKSITFEYDAYIENIDKATTYANADIQTNESIIINGGYICVFGFGLRQNNVETNTWQNEADIFLPPNNPDSLALTPIVTDIEIQDIVASNYAGIATVTKTGNTVIDGHYTLGTEENPAIWYVSGDLTTTGEVTFSGYGILAVDGDIQVDHKVYSTGGNNYLEGNLAIYSSSNINLNKDVEAHLYASGSVTTSVNGVTITGGITTKDEFDFNGYLGVMHRTPSESIVKPVFGNNYEAVKMVSTREWAVESVSP